MDSMVEITLVAAVAVAHITQNHKAADKVVQA
jgi:hypothetical protein